MKCKYCQRMAIGYIKDEPICKQCARVVYVFIDGKRYLRSDLVRDETGRWRKSGLINAYKDFFTGEIFYSSSVKKVQGKGQLSLKSYKLLKDAGKLIETGNGVLWKDDIIRDETGQFIRSSNKTDYLHMCSACKKEFLSVRTVNEEAGYGGLLCLSCAIKAGRSMCIKCGNHFAKPFISAEIIRMFGMQSNVGHICDLCLTSSLPLLYNSIREYDGIGRTIGVEIECEPTIESQISLAQWSSNDYHMVTGTTDGSLRGKFPCEFVSPILHESNYEQWLFELGHRLTARVYVRCGLHIHLGTQEYGWFELNNIMRYTKRYEGFFFSIVSPSRSISGVLNGNNAGLPVLLPEIPKFKSREELLNWCYGSEHKCKEVGSQIPSSKRCNDKQVHYNGNLNRYQWMNFHGHFFKGAIEVRSHQGTSNVNKIKNWIELWLNILPHAALPEKLWRDPMKVIPKHLELYYKERAKKFLSLSNKRLEIGG